MPAARGHQQQVGGVQGGMGGGVPGMSASFGQRRQGFSEAIVFTVGGGSMDEYGNLQDWTKRTSGGGAGGASGGGSGGGAGGGPRRRVVYGSTDLVNAEEFVVGELARLGREGA